MITTCTFYSKAETKDAAIDFRKDIPQQIQLIDDFRKASAKAVPAKPTLKTFKAVCKPVGKRLKILAKNKKWKIRQTSHKYRNPKHRPTMLEAKIIKDFLDKPHMKDYWYNEGTKIHYFKRISTDQKCLACHGMAKSTPKFIKKKYPNDKAINFLQGDLRGLYHVEINGTPQ